MTTRDHAGQEANPDHNPLIRKLESLATITDDDRVLLAKLTANPQTVPPHVDLIQEGDKPNGVYLVMDGIACRYKRINESRQIMAYLVAGDFCDLDVALLDTMDHAIGTLTPCEVVRIDLAAIQDLQLNHPTIAHALRLATLVDEATLREWLVNVGGRSTEERIAHLMCEMLLRLQAVGRATQDSYDLPLTPVDLADTTGLSNVHVNRAIQTLERDKLIAFDKATVRILDLPALIRLCGFNPNYLHLGRRKAA